eukprot:418242_1
MSLFRRIVRISRNCHINYGLLSFGKPSIIRNQWLLNEYRTFGSKGPQSNLRQEWNEGRITLKKELHKFVSNYPFLSRIIAVSLLFSQNVSLSVFLAIVMFVYFL